MRGRLRLAIVLVLTALTVGGLVLAFSVFQPTPPRTVEFATGPEGSAYRDFAEQYRQIFAENRIELRLRPTAGAIENLELLADPDSGIDAAFLSMGPGDNVPTEGLESLGGVFYEALWFFHHDLDFSGNFVSGVSGKTLSIGPPGSASNAAARILFELNDIDVTGANIVELAPGDAAKALLDGDIDAVFISSAAASDDIMQLLSDPAITLQEFSQVDAYTALFPALTKLTVPAGLGSLALNIPPNDVQILAHTAIIGVRPELHDAIQSLLLEAASQVHSRPDAFHASGRFPAPVTYHLPLSNMAKRYYESGRPFLQR